MTKILLIHQNVISNDLMCPPEITTKAFSKSTTNKFTTVSWFEMHIDVIKVEIENTN